jgi:hypothetical protein
MRARSLGSRGGGRGAFDGLGGYRSSHDDASDGGESEKLGRGRLGMVELWGWVELGRSCMELRGSNEM